MTDFFNDLAEADATDLRKLWTRMEEKVQEGHEVSPYSSTPDVMYHYADATAFKGIIEDGTVWATDILDMNDPSEIIHGIDIGKRALIELLQGKPTNYERFLNFFLRVMDPKHLREIAFITAFCASYKENDLNQWRAYGSFGSGFSIGFKVRDFERSWQESIAQSGAGSIGAWTMSYKDAQLFDRHVELFRMAEPYIDRYKFGELSQQVEKYYNGLIGTIGANLISASASHKHEAYKEEEEYRILQLFGLGYDHSQTKFRYCRNKLSRYIEFNWKSVCPESLTSIWIGPTNNTTKNDIQDYLRLFGIKHQVEIKKSDIPFRL